MSNAAALNFETTPTFSLTLSASDGTLSDNAIITINLNNVNELPSAADATVSLNENAANGTAVHTVSASDPDGDALTYAITAGNIGTAFVVNSATGVIAVSNAAALNFETTPTFSLTLSASDGTLSDNAIITINLNNVNELPSAADATVSLNENAPNATVVHTVSASDPDGDALTYAITGGNVNNAFMISGDGMIFVNDFSQLDFETSPTLLITVQVSDGERVAEALITIQLQDMNEPPHLENAVITIDPGVPNGTAVYRFVSEDPDAGDTAFFSIEDGNSNSAFMIDEATGEITINDNDQFDLLANAVFELTIKVRDAAGLNAAATLIIHIQNIVGDNGIYPLKGFSPNGDGINDFWLIRGIEAFPDNEVKVFNRWGNLVFETRNYDNNNIAWRGVSDNNGPETTYYFLIKAKGLQPVTGYVIVKE